MVRGACPPALEALGLLPHIPWDTGLAAAWAPGEAGAQARLSSNSEFETNTWRSGRKHRGSAASARPGEAQRARWPPRESVAARRRSHGRRSGPEIWNCCRLRDFLPRADAYAERRDLPGQSGASRLSPHLHFGEVSPRQVPVALAGAVPGGPAGTGEPFVRELGWREFAHQLLYHYPHTTQEPLDPRFAAFPWRTDGAADLLAAWQAGRTGIPLVDAGMRELWETGFMHNRVRMVVAALLTKHLRLPWQAGARWFWDTLVDADLAANTLGWQWSAGCGADAAPYFRIVNPVRQGERFDPDGAYVRRWCPELAALPGRWLHQPLGRPDPAVPNLGARSVPVGAAPRRDGLAWWPAGSLRGRAEAALPRCFRPRCQVLLSNLELLAPTPVLSAAGAVLGRDYRPPSSTWPRPGTRPWPPGHRST